MNENQCTVKKKIYIYSNILLLELLFHFILGHLFISSLMCDFYAAMPG